jgi:aryl-alcohol dehydrogenase-like predicted oxidoreductase
LESGPAGHGLTLNFTLRQIGKSEIKVSPITLGTMRIDRAEDVIGLLTDAFRLGITSLHCSSEYETYPVFRDALRDLGGSVPAGVTVIAKLAAPHFGEDRFSAADFRSKVQFYLDTLGLDQLHVVQWLLRYDLKNDDVGVRIFDEAANQVAEMIRDLKEQGLIGACVGFPYSAPIAERMVAVGFLDGLAVYVNPLEREMDAFVAAAAARGKSIVAIRPFAAGRVFAETLLNHTEALEHVFGLSGVATAVVSASSTEHLEQLRGAFNHS